MPLTLFKRPGSDNWHYRGTVAKRRLRASTGTADKTTAERIKAEAEARHWKGHLDGPESILTFAQAAILYRAAEKSTRHLTLVENYWKDTLVQKITAGAVRQAAIDLYPKASGATRNRQVIVPTQAIINHAASLELCRKLSIERFPVIRKEKEPATWAWVEAFMKHANPHLGALACFLFLTGSRISDALNVTWEDVDFQKRQVVIRQGKLGGDERIARLPDKLLIAIANFPDRKERVFKYVSRISAGPQWEKAVKRAGIKPLSFHSCRHGFATGLLDKGVNPKTVAARGGWKTVEYMLKHYAHDVASEDVTDLLIDTPETQQIRDNPAIERKA